jgi:hypothetical protein
VRFEGETPRADESGSTDCCPIAVGANSGEFADTDVPAPVPQELVVGGQDSTSLLSRPFLTGVWEGVMTGVGAQPDGSPSVTPPFDAARGQYRFRLNIGTTNLVMYFQNGDQWIGLGEGQDLRTNEQGRSAIVSTSLQAANGATEALMLNIVRWDELTIAVQMSRVTGAGPRGGALPLPVNSMGILNRAAWMPPP